MTSKAEFAGQNVPDPRENRTGTSQEYSSSRLFSRRGGTRPGMVPSHVSAAAGQATDGATLRRTSPGVTVGDGAAEQDNWVSDEDLPASLREKVRRDAERVVGALQRNATSIHNWLAFSQREVFGTVVTDPPIDGWDGTGELIFKSTTARKGSDDHKGS